MTRLLPLPLLIAAVVQPAFAAERWAAAPLKKKPDQLWINVGGISQHFDNASALNQENFGYGLEYQVDRNRYLVAGAYRNSVHADTRYLGAAWLPLSYKALKLGAIAGVANGYKDMRNGGFFPVVLPVIAIEGERVGANFVYVPSIPAKVSGAVAMQLKYRFD